MADIKRRPKELLFVEQLARRFKSQERSVRVGIGDDAAVIVADAQKFLLATCDMLVESVHFKKGDDLKKVGYKAMAVSVSDIAAMGGIPKYALISVGLPLRGSQEKLKALSSGLRRCALRFKVAVVGGDTNRSPSVTVDVFMVGEVEKEKVILRSGAKPGDYIFVTGALGGSAKSKHLTFKPRLWEARFLVDHFKPTAMIDLSDGLAMDLNRLSEASGVGAQIFEEDLPRSQGVVKTANALYDGEDFELLFTLSKAKASAFLKKVAGGKTGFKVTCIGRMVKSVRGVRMVKAAGGLKRVEPRGFAHFR